MKPQQITDHVEALKDMGVKIPNRVVRRWERQAKGVDPRITQETTRLENLGLKVPGWLIRKWDKELSTEYIDWKQWRR